MTNQYATRAAALFAGIATITKESKKCGIDLFEDRPEQVGTHLITYVNEKAGEIEARASFVELSTENTETTSKPEKVKGTLSAKLMAKIPAGEFTVADLDTNTIFKALSAGIIKVVSEIKLAGRGRPSKIYAMA